MNVKTRELHIDSVLDLDTRIGLLAVSFDVASLSYYHFSGGKKFLH